MLKRVVIFVAFIILFYVLVQNGERMGFLLLAPYLLTNFFQFTAIASKGKGLAHRDSTRATVDAFYGSVQVQATSSNGKMSSVQFYSIRVMLCEPMPNLSNQY